MFTDASGNTVISNVIAFFTLPLIGAATVLMMRYSQLIRYDVDDDNNGAFIDADDNYPSTFAKTSAVAAAEGGKVLVGVAIALYQLSTSPQSNNANAEAVAMTVVSGNNGPSKNASPQEHTGNAVSVLFRQVFGNKATLFKMGVPAAVYAVQNYLLFLALSYLESSIYQITYQIKTFTAALFAMVMLGARYSRLQWISFILLAGGGALANVMFANKADDSESGDAMAKTRMHDTILGVGCVVCAACTSGFAGVFMELQLKQARVSLYVKNIQLGIFGFLVTLLVSYLSGDLFSIVIPYGFFCNFSTPTWIAVGLNIAGGYCVAFVLKNASNIIKSFAAGMTIIFVVLGSWMFFNDTAIDIWFSIPVALVLVGNMIFNREKLKSQKQAQRNTKETPTGVESSEVEDLLGNNMLVIKAQN